MNSGDRQKLCSGLLTVALLAAVGPAAFCQVIQAPLNQGFVRSSSIRANVDEMLGTRLRREPGEAIYGPGYPRLWIAEIQYKPVRILLMRVTDPVTGRQNVENVWYMVYRMIPRDYVELAGDEAAQDNLARRLNDIDVDPQNDLDDVRAHSLFMPRFTLQTTDEGSRFRYLDEVNHQIQQAVFRREFQREASRLPLLNSVDAINRVMEPVRSDDPNPLAKAWYGVAIWRNVDPETDFFEVEILGVSNAYRVTAAADGQLSVEDKGLRQKFRRPGDAINQSEREIRLVGDPEWIYLPRNDTVKVPDAVSVLANRPEAAEDDAEAP